MSLELGRNLGHLDSLVVAMAVAGRLVATAVATDTLAPVGSWAENMRAAADEFELEAAHNVADSRGGWGELDNLESGRQRVPAVLADTVAESVDTAGMVLGTGSCQNGLEAGRALDSLGAGDTL
jgi:hypothetical protein